MPVVEKLCHDCDKERRMPGLSYCRGCYNTRMRKVHREKRARRKAEATS